MRCVNNECNETEERSERSKRGEKSERRDTIIINVQKGSAKIRLQFSIVTI